MPDQSLIYLDHNATTPAYPEVVEVMARVQQDAWANPGSRHQVGRRARQVLEESRERVAALLGAKPKEVVFTSGGTEANNLAIRGLAGGTRRRVARLPGEHPSIHEPIERLLSEGRELEPLPLTGQGAIDSSAAERLAWDRVGLAAVVLAHSETGVIRDLDVLRRLCGEHRVAWHVDAVQAVGKLDVNFRAIGATTLALAAHKFGGPRGIGALLVADGARLTPLAAGGLQEWERRPGTEPVALIAGMTEALSICRRDREQRASELLRLRSRLEEGLRERCQPMVLHGAEVERLPNTVNAAFPGCDGDALLVALDLAGVCASLGTACASGSTEPAPILVAMGCPREVQTSSVRFSLGWTTQAAEIDAAIDRIAATVARLRTP